jgi:hypothetical protein
MNIDTRQQIKPALPALSRRQVQALLLAALKKQNKVRMVGKISAAKWYPENKGSIVPTREK